MTGLDIEIPVYFLMSSFESMEQEMIHKDIGNPCMSIFDASKSSSITCLERLRDADLT